MPYESMSEEVAMYLISLLRGELDTPVMRGFREVNKRLNALADESPHISYRFKDERTNDGLDHRLYDNPLIISQLIVAPSTIEIMRFGNGRMYGIAKRNLGPRYFDQETLRESFPETQVLFYVEKGARPTLEEGKAKLTELITDGPSRDVFTLRKEVGAW